MSDVGDDYRVLNQLKKDRHARWFEQNTQTLYESKIPYTDKGEAFLFRETGMKKIDFYPSTGRWKFNIGKERFVKNGGAKKFLTWYKEKGKL